MLWVKMGYKVRADGTDLRYASPATDIQIESRKRAIPHANGVGVWYHTTYFVIRPDGTEKEYQRLSDAKEAAEEEVVNHD